MVAYKVVLSWEWCYPLRVYIMNDGSFMVLPDDDGGFSKIPHEVYNPISFEINEVWEKKNCIGTILGNYAILNKYGVQNARETTTTHTFEGCWKMAFDGTYYKFEYGVGAVFGIPRVEISLHSFKVKF